jgi:hypothetical protein
MLAMIPQAFASPPLVVCTLADVPDSVTAGFAVAFYNTLKFNGGDIHRAFETAVAAMMRFYPGMEEPVLLNGRLARLFHQARDPEWLWRLIALAGLAVAVGALLWG